mmetsp:Transcript_20736/g.73228  ORF Transcript_20736/g.73228 Transcript_20736/m.73228 type:complete len:252 (-) Transcript_20736:1144-1899(-)
MTSCVKKSRAAMACATLCCAFFHTRLRTRASALNANGVASAITLLTTNSASTSWKMPAPAWSARQAYESGWKRFCVDCRTLTRKSVSLKPNVGPRSMYGSASCAKEKICSSMFSILAMKRRHTSVLTCVPPLSHFSNLDSAVRMGGCSALSTDTATGTMKSAKGASTSPPVALITLASCALVMVSWMMTNAAPPCSATLSSRPTPRRVYRIASCLMLRLRCRSATSSSCSASRICSPMAYLRSATSVATSE